MSKKTCSNTKSKTLNIQGSLFLIFTVISLATGFYILFLNAKLNDEILRINSEIIVLTKQAINSSDTPPMRFSRIFAEDMPHPVTSDDRDASTVDLGNGLEIHQCWCYGIKVRSYNPDYNWNQEESNGFWIHQDPTTKDLIITDNEFFVARYVFSKEYTYTYVYDGMRSFRFANFSLYLYANGSADAYFVDSSIDTIRMRDKWAWAEETEDWPLPRDLILELDTKHTSELLTLGLPLSGRNN